MAKKPSIGPKFGLPNFFSLILPLLHIKHCCKLSLYAISRKNNETKLEKMVKKTSFRTDFGHFGPNLGLNFFSQILTLLHVRNWCKLSLYTISRKTNEPNLRNWPKTQFWTQFWPVLSQIWSAIFFYEFYLYQMLCISASNHCMQF